ncbi:Protein ROH1-like [Dillenia turbinata]|uniref:Protein ROH1-like n=1 Tax=Dillenia turbinata TaxID=194707 RepID=A0AAN8W589_9MAGN
MLLGMGLKGLVNGRDNWRLSALDSRQRALGDGQLRRARKALMDLALAMLDEKESKKRERRNSNGLLKEIHQIEKGARHMTGLVDSVHFSIVGATKNTSGTGGTGVGTVPKNGLDPLACQVREMFHKIMSCRTDGLELLCQGSRAE